MHPSAELDERFAFLFCFYPLLLSIQYCCALLYSEVFCTVLYCVTDNRAVRKKVKSAAVGCCFNFISRKELSSLTSSYGRFIAHGVN